jgi:hypothetical protein
VIAEEELQFIFLVHLVVAYCMLEPKTVFHLDLITEVPLDGTAVVEVAKHS